MRKKFVSFLKGHVTIFNVYSYVLSTFVKFLRLFIHTDEKLILFVSYGGRYYNDSPRCIYQMMLDDPRFSGYKLYWGFIHPDSFEFIPNRVRIDSLKYFKIALKARCWITNVAIERGLNFTGKHTLYFHTTHGTIPKLSGYDDKLTMQFTKKFRYKYDISCAQSLYEKEKQLQMYALKDEQVIITGYPKNDILVNPSPSYVLSLRQKIGIPEGKVAILYAPTFRDNIYDDMKCDINFNRWHSILGDKYVILYRAHPVVANKTSFDSQSGFVVDCSEYPENCELMIAADMLISDYSGIFFEFGVQEKPMFCYAYDYEEYNAKRGLYMDVRKEIPGGTLGEDELLSYIKNGTKDQFLSELRSFKQKYIQEYGHSTESCVNIIYERIII